jgi:hypothetical protein
VTDFTGARHFRIHDISQFPVVRARASTVHPGYGPDWIREMEHLLSAATPFVLLYCETLPEEDHEDFKLRGIWMKVNRERLAAHCKAVIRVEPDAKKRTKVFQHSVGTQRAFGVPTEVVSTIEEALIRAGTLCAGHYDPGGIAGADRTGHVS